MKTAYEIAMERLGKSSPSVKLTSDQKAKLAELDSVYSAKIAEREIFLKGEMSKALESGQYEVLGSLEQQLNNDRKVLQSELEEKKELIRRQAS